MKAGNMSDDIYIKNNTMYLSGTKWYNSKDVEANILNIAHIKYIK